MIHSTGDGDLQVAECCMRSSLTLEMRASFAHQFHRRWERLMDQLAMRPHLVPMMSASPQASGWDGAAAPTGFTPLLLHHRRAREAEWNEVWNAVWTDTTLIHYSQSNNGEVERHRGELSVVSSSGVRLKPLRFSRLVAQPPTHSTVAASKNDSDTAAPASSSSDGDRGSSRWHIRELDRMAAFRQLRLSPLSVPQRNDNPCALSTVASSSSSLRRGLSPRSSLIDRPPACAAEDGRFASKRAMFIMLEREIGVRHTLVRTAFIEREAMRLRAWVESIEPAHRAEIEARAARCWEAQKAAFCQAVVLADIESAMVECHKAESYARATAIVTERAAATDLFASWPCFLQRHIDGCEGQRAKDEASWEKRLLARLSLDAAIAEREQNAHLHEMLEAATTHREALMLRRLYIKHFVAIEETELLARRSLVTSMLQAYVAGMLSLIQMRETCERRLIDGCCDRIKSEWQAWMDACRITAADPLARDDENLVLTDDQPGMDGQRPHPSFSQKCESVLSISHQRDLLERQPPQPIRWVTGVASDAPICQIDTFQQHCVDCQSQLQTALMGLVARMADYTVYSTPH